MKKLSVFLVSLLILFPSPAMACSCIGKSVLKHEFNYVNVVFTGRVLAERDIKQRILPEIEEEDEHLGDRFYYTFSKEFTFLVEELHKGKAVTDTIKVITGYGKGDCGYRFKTGEKYIVFSYYTQAYFERETEQKKFLETNICRYTKPYGRFSEKEKRKLDKLQKRYKKNNP
ncbi:hypothetical protein [Flavobacterium alkalisoli]|uniref:hypothetical protein n=1 Tax=Flavobacterium alkalisoli TaxID=2602769 RepID=UPI003A8D9DAD